MRKEADIEEGRRGINNRETAIIELLRIILIILNNQILLANRMLKYIARFFISRSTNMSYVLKVIEVYLNMTNINEIKCFLANVTLF